ncbi:hypothetical protein VTN02DRAFT_6305 [Thermoascus thermophilus]
MKRYRSFCQRVPSHCLGDIAIGTVRRLNTHSHGLSRLQLPAFYPVSALLRHVTHVVPWMSSIENSLVMKSQHLLGTSSAFHTLVFYPKPTFLSVAAHIPRNGQGSHAIRASGTPRFTLCPLSGNCFSSEDGVAGGLLLRKEGSRALHGPRRLSPLDLPRRNRIRSRRPVEDGTLGQNCRDGFKFPSRTRMSRTSSDALPPPPPPEMTSSRSLRRWRRPTQSNGMRSTSPWTRSSPYRS